MEIKPENYFYLKNGTVIKNLFELDKALEKMPDEVFRHHVNESRNDFYSWIKDVFKEKELAESIKNVKDRNALRKKVADKVQWDVLRNMKEHKKEVLGVDAKKAEIKPAKIEINPKIELRKIEFKKETEAKKTEAEKQKLREKAQKLLFETTKEKPGISEINPANIHYGINCPYKSFYCGALEFVFGIIIGLLAAFVLMNIIK